MTDSPRRPRGSNSRPFPFPTRTAARPFAQPLLLARLLLTALLLTMLLLAVPAHATEATVPPAGDTAGGQVTLPLDDYQRLLQLAATQPLPSPSSYAVGQAVLDIVFVRRDQRIAATVTADLQIETFADDWTLVPVLGPGAALGAATVDGQPVQLVQRPEGLFWLAEGRSRARLRLTYHADARAGERAWVASLPVPPAAASRFTLKVPATGIDLAVAPSANLALSERGGHTVATGTLPTSPAVMISWRTAIERPYVLSRAEYRGEWQPALMRPISGGTGSGSGARSAGGSGTGGASGISHGSNSGTTSGAITWQADIDAEVLIDGEVTVPLVAAATTLIGVDVDGAPASVFDDRFDGQHRFAVRIAGAGRHRITLRFLSAVIAPDGVPTSGFDIPDVPVSRFELSLPGDKVVQALASTAAGAIATPPTGHPELIRPGGTPPDMGLPIEPAPGQRIAASVVTRHEDGVTHATFHVPMSRRLALSWMEAIPADVDVERRANAVVYQALHAAEGVLYGQAAIRYEITRGATRELAFTLPAAAQVNRVTTASDAIADWIVEPVEQESASSGQNRIRVFLNRDVSGEFVLDVTYEQLLEDRARTAPQAASEEPATPPGATPGAPPASPPITAPLLRALGVTRQKGMIALLANTDLALAPAAHPDMSEVGENQLPGFFRNRLAQTVSHTFKYHSDRARLSVATVTPERRQGKFNAQVDTLVSIGEVTLKGQVAIDNDVKSGVLRELRLWLPADLNILGVSGPSIRNHAVTQDNGRQAVDIEFTREMDGRFRIELNYERILIDGAAEADTAPVAVPRVDVEGADVVQGRIAIEALAALEVQPATTTQLSTLDIAELPRQLVLKTTNPILLAYRYVRTDTPIDLRLRITRHREIDVQVAAIDSAHYQTLYTADGLAVTRVRFEVRNARRQFLRLALPPGSEVWSVFVNGEAEKPAYARDSGAAPGTHPGMPASPDMPASERDVTRGKTNVTQRPNGDASTDVLIRMINSSTPFPVELVYATRGEGMHAFGALEGRLPRPDMIVTRTSWDVYVPADPRYAAPKTNMDLITAGVAATLRDASAELLRGAVDGALKSVITGEPLHIELPTQGIRYRFAKLYANQSPEDARFRLRYVHPTAGFAGLWLSLLATLAIWAGIALLWVRNAMRAECDSSGQRLDHGSGQSLGQSDNAERLSALSSNSPAATPWLLLTAGAIALTVSLTTLSASTLPPSILSLAIGLGLVGWTNWRRIRA
ncbi:hypothetical protein [Elongatibacter sediminis]|uniref:Cyclic di-GMP-binding protein n=1 Tax=Elongatibacter sediminis TaxID=3119006 RepID=A0AAW9R7U1_9GAMM